MEITEEHTHGNHRLMRTVWQRGYPELKLAVLSDLRSANLASLRIGDGALAGLEPERGGRLAFHLGQPPAPVSS